MQRVPASPGGPQVSNVKRQRVADLKSAYGGKGNGGSQPPPAGGSSGGGGSRVQRDSEPPSAAAADANASTSGPAGVRAGEFPYDALPEGLRDGSLATYFRAAVASSSGRITPPPPASGSNTNNRWNRDRDRDAPRAPSFLDQCVAELLATTPGQSADALAANALRVADKTLALENPVRAIGSSNAQAGLKLKPQGYADKLVRRLKGRPGIVKQLRHPTLAAKSAVSYASLQGLHAAWKKYVAGLMPEGAAGQPGPSAAAATPAVTEERLLAQVDLHGCLLTVLRSTDVRHAGVNGVVAAVTPRVLCIVSSDDRLHVVPARGSVFQYHGPGGRVVTLQGAVLQSQAARGGG